LQFTNLFSLNHLAIDIADNTDDQLQEQNKGSSEKNPNGFTSAQSAWQMEALKSHNSFRAHHGVSALVLDDEISHKAQVYAEYLAKNNRLEHSSDRNGLGECLYGACGSESLMNNSLGELKSLFSFNIFLVTGTEATQSWYDEIKNYNYHKPGFSSTTGHFTQVVWKNTSKLGIGVAFADEGRRAVVVARYSPPGNVAEQFLENVPAPK
jgi:uncharacterized protein YkwD